MEYNGTERRKGMNELTDIKVEIASLSTKVTEWMSTTQQYRRDLCAKNDMIRSELKEYRTEVKVELTNLNSKIEDVREKIDKLPCPAREEITKGVRKDLDKIWLWITSIVIAIAGSWVGMVIKK